jgi:hypothetical protein
MVVLPDMPERIARLPRDKRGYPVPWFVWFNEAGEPDFRVIKPGALADAFNHKRCWICGDRLGVHRVYVIGPMCVVNRVTSEPPSHRGCAEFAATACPFLTKPRMRRNDKDLPADASQRGIAIERNPGAVALYQTDVAKPFRVEGGFLFRLGAPQRIDWYAEGRPATRAEIMHSIDTGFPLLMDMAVKHDGPAGVAKLNRMREVALALLPAA